VIVGEQHPDHGRASFRRQLDGQGRSPAGRALEGERAASIFHAILNAA